MKLQLTDRFCSHAKPQSGEAQSDYFDDTVAGLALRVAASGRKSWTLPFTSPGDGKRARMTLGTYPATSLGAARTLAVETSSRGGTLELLAQPMKPYSRFARSISVERSCAVRAGMRAYLNALFIRSWVLA